MTSPTEVIRANRDGTGREVIGTFDSIVTYSEYVFYPQVQWAANNTQAFIAIPSADPLVPDAHAILWNVPATGPATNNGRLDNNNFLFAPVLWSPNGRYATTTFAQNTVDGGRLETVVIIYMTQRPVTPSRSISPAT